MGIARPVSATKSVTTSASAIVASKTIVSGAILQSIDGNGGLIYIGGSGVTAANGYQLSAGESISLNVLFQSKGVYEWDLSGVYAIGSAGTQDLRIIYPAISGS